MTINLLLILLLATLHLSVGYWRWPKAISVFPWSAIAGGIAIAYVFLDLLPSLNEAEIAFTHSRLHSTQELYLVSLLGLLLIHGLHAQMHSDLLFKTAILSNATSNFLFSYLLNHMSETLSCLLLFIAVGLHYWVNDYGLMEHFPKQYRRVGRWLLAAALMAGWALAQIVMVQGSQSEEQTVAIAAIQAFLAGSIILNVLTHELPEANQDKLLPFTASALGYAAILFVA